MAAPIPTLKVGDREVKFLRIGQKYKDLMPLEFKIYYLLAVTGKTLSARDLELVAGHMTRRTTLTAMRNLEKDGLATLVKRDGRFCITAITGVDHD